MGTRGHREDCACAGCRPVHVEVAVARFKALATPGGGAGLGMPVLKDALGLPVDVGDLVWWPILETGAQKLGWRSGHVMERAMDALHVVVDQTERKQWLRPDRCIAVTRLLKGDK